MVKIKKKNQWLTGVQNEEGRDGEVYQRGFFKVIKLFFMIL